MEKHCLKNNSTEVSSLVNPPLLSKFQKLQIDALENVYASKKAPLGKGPPPTIPTEVIEKGFGISNEKGDSAGSVMYPSTRRVFKSIYTEKYQPPDRSHRIEVPPAGLKMEGFDNHGMQMKDIFSELRTEDATAIIPIPRVHGGNIKHGEDIQYAPNYSIGNIKSTADHFGSSSPSKSQRSLLCELRNLLNMRNCFCPVDFPTFLKVYLQNFRTHCTLTDLQQMFTNLGVSVDISTLKDVLGEFNVLDDSGELDYDKFLIALNWRAMPNENSMIKKLNCNGDGRRNILSHSNEYSRELFKTTASLIGDHTSTVPAKTAGVPTIRNDLRKPMLRHVTDFQEYGDVGSGSSIIQPNIFEKHGIYEDDLGSLKSKEEIKSVLLESGISFNAGLFDIIWTKISKDETASIGKIWNAMKHVCLTENNLFCC